MKKLTIKKRDPFKNMDKVLVHHGRLMKKACRYSPKRDEWRCMICEKAVTEDSVHILVTKTKAVDIIHQNRIEGGTHAAMFRKGLV